MGCCSSSYSQPQPVQSKFFPDFEKALPRLEGKVVVITGCTTGTGFVCARTCAKLGAHVVMLNRASDRATSAHAAISALGKATSIACDLGSFSSVRAAIAEVQRLFGETGVDVLCNNAGVMALEDKATGDGYDVQMQTNHLSHFMLTKDLFPLLEKAAALRGEARVVQHSSVARKLPAIPLDTSHLGKNGGNLGGNGASMLFGGARWKRYHQTKLANAIFCHTLAAKLAAKGSTVKSLCAAPGFAATNLQVTTHQQGGMSETCIMRFAQSAEDGTMPLLHCCIGPEAMNGQFFEPKGMGGRAVRKDLEKICTDPKACETLWSQSEAACGEWKL